MGTLVEQRALKGCPVPRRAAEGERTGGELGHRGVGVDRERRRVGGQRGAHGSEQGEIEPPR